MPESGAPPKTTQYRYMDTHAGQVQVGNNVVPVGMGDFVDLTDEDTRKKDNAPLIKDGLLVAVDDMEEGDEE